MIVKTYNNREEKRENCVFIRGKYYHKERDCYFYNGIFYSPFSRYLVFDEATGKRVHVLAEKLQYGVVSFAEGTPRFGHYSANILTNGKICIPENISDDALSKAMSECPMSLDSESPEALMPEGVHISSSRRRRPLDISGTIVEEYTPQPDSGRSSQPRIYNCMNVWPLMKSGFIASKNTDVLANPQDFKTIERATGLPFNKRTAANAYDFNLAYNSEVMMDSFQKIYNDMTFDVDNKTRTNALAQLIGDRSFGIEYEAWDGRLNTFFCAKSGLIPLRDGSLRHDGICGYEYATVIMGGVKGLSAIKEQCRFLNNYTTFNERCSMHIHIGNIPRTKENLENIYKALYSIQGSLYSLFPACLINTATYKQKAYCSPLPAITGGADGIVNFLSDGTERFGSFGRPHPRDNSGQSKWSINSRYSIANLNGFYYTSRGTVELRISTPTYNHNKVAALLVIFAAIINEAIAGRFYNTIETLLACNAFSEVPKSVKTWLSNYVKHRIGVLSAYTISGNAVKYFEDHKNDNTTGNEEELY